MTSGRRPMALLLLYGALVVPAMFSRDLWDPDEPRFAQIGREMLRTGDWVLPRMNGEPLALLPPLYDWVSAAAGAPAGDVTPAAARAGAALGGLLALLSAWFLARRWWGDAAAGWSAAVLMTSFGFWWQASYAQVDMLLVGCVTASIAAFRVAWEEGDRGFRWFFAGCGLSALGTLTKGPVAAVLPGLVFLVLAIAERRRGFLRPAWLLAGLAAWLAVVAPWYVLACRRGGPEFAHELIVKHNFGMFFETWSHHKPPWYYVVNLPWLFAPWIVLLPSAVADGVRVRRENPSGDEAGRHRFLWIWAGALFVFFSVSQAKQGKYVLPAFPPLALLVGLRLASGRPLPRAALGVLVLAAAAALGAATAFGVHAGTLVPAEYREEASRLGFLAVLPLFGVACWIAAPLKPFRHKARELVLAGIAAPLFLAPLALFPRVDRLKSARPLCEWMRPQMRPEDRVGIYGVQERKIGAFRYYLDRPLDTFEDARERFDPASLAAWWKGHGPRWLLLDESDLPGLPADLQESMFSLERRSVGHRWIQVVRRPWLVFRAEGPGRWTLEGRSLDGPGARAAMRATRPDTMPVLERVNRLATVEIVVRADDPSAAILDLVDEGAQTAILHYVVVSEGRRCAIVLPQDKCTWEGMRWEVRVALCAADPEMHRAGWIQHAPGTRGASPRPMTHGWIGGETEPPIELAGPAAFAELARRATARVERRPVDASGVAVVLEADLNIPAAQWVDMWLALKAAGWENPELAWTPK
ncbi:MAG: glycosyltransferase family 39 protein [Planctomycetia bacterium]|nr:glycosyltransferase family 39 protein [Planctomycetia bacterium]